MILSISNTPEESPPTTGAAPRRYRILFAAVRGLAFLLGIFTLLNVLGELRNPGFDANLWWIDLRFANRALNRLLMFAVGAGLISLAVRPSLAPFRGWVMRALLGLLILVAAMNTATFYRLLSVGAVRSGSAIPLSALVLAMLGFLAWGTSSSQRFVKPGRLEFLSFTISVALGSLLFPLAQMYCFGLTDYRRPADIIVVFGCRVGANGVPSMALSDRVKTGVELYHAGLAPRMVFSGGPGVGAIHETEAMRTLAIELGVPSDAIEQDLDGLNTQATVRNLVAGHPTGSQPRVLAVSNYYHLPRIKLCFRRAGWEVWTVPAKESRRLYYQERFLMREIAALWWYYLNPN